MKKVNRRRMDDSAKNNVWRSYSDMMSGLLLLFVLIMAVCLMQAQKNYTEKLAEQAKLIKSQTELEESQNQVQEQQEQLAQQESELEQQQSTLSEQAASLEALQAILEAQQASLAEKESEVEAQNAVILQKESELAASQTQLEASQSQLDQANELMQQQQTRIDQIIGVKADLIEDLNEEFAKNKINVLIDTDTGAIVLDSSVLFEFSESELVDEGKMILDDVLPVYCKVLLSKEYYDYVAEIIIDGYTDSVGEYTDNLRLSQARANAVAQYLLGHMDEFLSAKKRRQLMEKLTANGKSSSNLVLDANGQEDAAASRRVEIKFRLKDEEMLTELQAIIEESRKSAAEVAGGETMTEETAAD